MAQKIMRMQNREVIFMPDIKIERPEEFKLKDMGIGNWPIWEKEASKFSWEYGDRETCYLLEGRATVTPENGRPVSFGAGDLVEFPPGMKCIWEIHENVRKHYRFG
jgi:hypothetical protein